MATCKVVERVPQYPTLVMSSRGDTKTMQSLWLSSSAAQQFEMLLNLNLSIVIEGKRMPFQALKKVHRTKRRR